MVKGLEHEPMPATTAAHFADSLAAAVRRCRNPVVVGLDPRFEQLPVGLHAGGAKPSWQQQADAYLKFCQGVIDVVADLVPAVKPQAAFFEQLGPAGMVALGQVLDYARQKGLFVILDGKRNDIGSTAIAYAEAFLGRPPLSAWGADAMTVSPYLGGDSLDPFVETASRRGAGLFVLVKTSNPGGALFQDVVADGLPMYRHVARHVQDLARQSAGAGGYGFVGAVVGATHPRQLTELRSAMPNTWFLVPGYGSQGGGARDVAGAFDPQGLGAIVSSSRAVIFAHALPEYSSRFGAGRWQEAVEAATRRMIAELQADTPAEKLAAG
jgi:orotidine-5'-phosphate decarboxylase